MTNETVVWAAAQAHARSTMDRRACLLGAASLAFPGVLLAQGMGMGAGGGKPAAALREMQIHKVPELGLSIWVENQPAWPAQLQTGGGHPSFVVQSPDNYHSPAVMMYSSWPKQQVTDAQMRVVANTAIQTASQNFGLDAGRARAIRQVEATHGVLKGMEGQFVGRQEGQAIDVRIFVGHSSGRFPVALTVYTLEGKMGNLSEVVRRAWGKVAYL
jgi:hypothetical protein